jgi:hypothetical protein
VITGCLACAGHDGALCCHSSSSTKPSSIIPGERAPGRLWGMSPSRGGEAPTSAGAERRTRWLALRQSPSLQRKGNSRSITRTGAPIGASPRRFSFVLGTAFRRRTGAPIRTPLIPRAFTRFHPLHQSVAGRTHVVGPGSVSRGPPGVRLTRPNPQAPNPAPFACVS